MGSALFVDGILVPNLEMGHHPLIKNKTYEQLLGNAARKRDGGKSWNRRLAYALERLQALLSCRKIHIGGGNTKKIQGKLPANVELVNNLAGIYGGVALWRDLQVASISSQSTVPSSPASPAEAEGAANDTETAASA